jgi:retron-type reverse transcriptase
MEVYEDEVIAELKQMNSKHKSSLEGFRPSVLLSVTDIILPHLTFLYNSSINSGVFPDKLKMARVIPIPKKGNSNEPSNYRPISLLSIFDKIFEKIMCRRLLRIWDKHNTFYKHQYGFRPKHSTTHALSEITDLIYKSLDDDYYVLGLFLDVSKAFDSVNHSILLEKLHHYGIRGNIHNWFTSYLSNRKQFVETNKAKSEMKTIAYGVPQGSSLGPLLFLLYINDLPVAITKGETRMFADDANYFNRNKNLNVLINEVQNELKNIYNWMLSNKLTINYDKTNFTIFSPKHGTDNEEKPNEIPFGTHRIKRVASTKYLGVIIDEKMKWKEHIDYIYNKLRRTFQYVL